MKKIKRLPLIILVAIVALIASVGCIIANSSAPAVAHADGDYRFEFTSYSVTYDIRSDRTMDVQLDVTALLKGYDSTGIIYDIPVNAGDRVRGVQAYSMDTGKPTKLDYSVENDDRDFVSVYLDDYRNKTGETHSYRITYEYAITKPVSANHIYLNAIGYGVEGEMSNITVNIKLPDGLIDASCYVGSRGTTADYAGYTLSGNEITMKLDSLMRYNGVTFDFAFADGVLSTKPDMTPYWIIIGACAVFAALFAVKLLCFNKNDITPIPSFSVPVNPPEGIKGGADAVYDDPTLEMDPLIMGKLIDNKVDDSDVTSLLYYWANKGYIKINMENQNDIVFIRIYKNLPEGTPHYQTVMYNNMFGSSELVHLNSLENRFYATVEQVRKEVNTKNGKLYSGKSTAAAVAFAILGVLAICVTPILIAIFKIHHSLLFAETLVMIIPAIVVFALTQAIRYKSLKFKKSKLLLMYGGVALLALICCGIYVLIVPSYVVETLPAFLLGVVGLAIVMASVFMISRTEEYTQKLNRILGFKDFIENVEKDKLEAMLESNPEFYYNVLPYAIVLGVSDKWENKFNGLTMQPPQWATGGFADTVFNVMVFNSLMRSFNTNMVRTFLSRPSSGSSSGFHGSFGGFGGGGHGGGGFRGK